MIFNENQSKAVNHPPGPLLILAGAGTGKTTAIIGRIARFITELKVNPENILALTFTVKAAENLKLELARVAGPAGMDIQACNFHAFAKTVSERYFDRLGYDGPPMVMEDADIYFLLREKFDELDTLRSSEYRRDPILAIQSLKLLFDRFRDELLSPEELYRLQRESLGELASAEDDRAREVLLKLADAVDIFPRYQGWKRDQGQVDFGDMVANLWRLVSEEGDILRELRDQYQHLFVDEFQDNNYALSQIVFKLAEPRRSITVVGDDDQCIYSFRGANLENVRQFKERYSGDPAYAEVSLYENYRSTQEILDLANSSIALNPGRMEKEKLTTGLKKHGLKPILALGDRQQQLTYLVQEISTLKAAGVSGSEIAILQRTHSKCIELAGNLSRLRLRTAYRYGRLFERTEIKDIAAYLQVLAGTPQQDQAFFRLIRAHFGTTAAERFLKLWRPRREKQTLLEASTDLADKLGEAVTDFCKGVRKLQAGTTTGTVRGILWEILVFSKLYRNTLEVETTEHAQQVNCLNQLQQLVRQFCEHYGDRDFQLFVRYFNVLWDVNATLIPQPARRAVSDEIQLMTVHNSKGLEFEHVFIPELTSSNFPQSFRRGALLANLPVSWRKLPGIEGGDREFHRAEERRLFYVAVTRARDRLHLTGPLKRQSEFIKPLRAPLVHRKELEMTESDSRDRIQEVFIEYQNLLLEETSAGHYEAAEQIVQALKALQKLENGVVPDWGENPYKSQILAKLGNDPSEKLSKLPELKLSATRIQRYQTCPLKYKFRDIDQIPEIPEKPYFNVGTVVHKVLEIFHRENYTALADLLKLLDEHWTSGGFGYAQEEDQFKEDAREMMRNYHEFLSRHPAQPWAVEKAFEFSLENCSITGKCDRIDVTRENVIRVIDYKTSKTKKSERDLRRDIQLAIYALFITRAASDDPDVQLGRVPDELTLLYLRHAEPAVTVHYTAEELDQFEEQIVETAAAIRRGEFEPKVGFNCKYCDYKNLICPEWG
ncbi:MAG: ATP-dependent helicase [FCB group bacterium]|nr:ATP-dependent helicase [FCB group bacterium]